MYICIDRAVNRDMDINIDIDVNMPQVFIWLFAMYLTPFSHSLTHSLTPQGIFLFSHLHQSRKKKRLNNNANLSLRRFRASFSFFTSETLDRSSLGEGQSEGQEKLKKQTGERRRGSDKTFYKEEPGEGE